MDYPALPNKSNLRITYEGNEFGIFDSVRRFTEYPDVLFEGLLCRHLDDEEVKITRAISESISSFVLQRNNFAFHFLPTQVVILSDESFDSLLQKLFQVKTSGIRALSSLRFVYMRECAKLDFATILTHEMFHSGSYEHVHYRVNEHNIARVSIRSGIHTLRQEHKFSFCLWFFNEAITENLACHVRIHTVLPGISKNEQELFSSRDQLGKHIILLFRGIIARYESKMGDGRILERLFEYDYFFGTFYALRELMNVLPDVIRVMRQYSMQHIDDADTMPKLFQQLQNL